MAHTRQLQHPNAALTPSQRFKMVCVVVDDQLPVTLAAQQFQVDPKTVRKWVARYLSEGREGLLDRSSRPHRSPYATPERKRREILDLRRRSRRGAGFISFMTKVPASTVQRICVRAGLGRLDRGDRSTGSPKRVIRRYLRETPGELIHVDVKKLAAIPDGGGWKVHGKHNAGPRQKVGWRYIHTAIDDRSRLGYSEIHTDETAATAAEFWARAAQSFAEIGVHCQRVLTDNGPCYQSRVFRDAVKATRTSHKRTQPYRLQTNGKVERFHRILNEEWAFAADWETDAQRTQAHKIFMHHYNNHRPHGALNWNTPTATLTQLQNRDNVLNMHN